LSTRTSFMLTSIIRFILLSCFLTACTTTGTQVQENNQETHSKNGAIVFKKPPKIPPLTKVANQTRLQVTFGTKLPKIVRNAYRWNRLEVWVDGLPMYVNAKLRSYKMDSKLLLFHGKTAAGGHNIRLRLQLVYVHPKRIGFQESIKIEITNSVLFSLTKNTATHIHVLFQLQNEGTRLPGMDPYRFGMTHTSKLK